MSPTRLMKEICKYVAIVAVGKLFHREEFVSAMILDLQNQGNQEDCVNDEAQLVILLLLLLLRHRHHLVE